MKFTYLLCILLIAFSAKGQGQAGFKATAKGAFYKIFTASPGVKIKMDDVISFNVIQKTEKDSILFSSYDNGAPVRIQVQPSRNIGDLMDIFPLLAAGDSALIKVPSDSLFKDYEEQRPEFLPTGAFLFFVVKILKVQSEEAAIVEKKNMEDKLKNEELVGLGKFIADSKSTFKATTSGLRYIILSPSLKRKPLAGDTVLVNYTGRTLDGKVFDSSIAAEAIKAGLQQPGRNYEPIRFVVGEEKVIKGWDEGLLLLNEGSKARFVIPSALAYGPNAMGDDIKAYATLVFDVDLVAVKPAKKEPVKAEPTKAPTAKPPIKKTTTVKKK